MPSSTRQSSLSPGEKQRGKSRSSSRSQRTPPTTRSATGDGTRRKGSSSETSKQNARDKHRAKRSESSASNQSTNPNSPNSKKSKNKSPSSNRKASSKRKKSSTVVSDDTKINDSERQDLTSRGLSIVPTEILQMITLRRLILANNNLAGIPSEIRFLVNLEHIDISRNPLRVKNGLDDYSCLPREFPQLRNLQTLIMSECALKHIPVSVWRTTSLQTLDISRNKIGYVVSEIGNLCYLRHLRLSQMDLDTLPAEIGFCEQLLTIDLTGNPIDNLPETLVELRQLYELKINYRTFYKFLDNYMFELIEEGKIRSEHIPKVIFELESLQILDLNQTKLNSIPDEHTLFHLQEFYLSNNTFFDIPSSISTMTHLKILDMSNNRLQTIPEHFIQIKRLEVLILSSNHLTILPSNLARLNTLKKLIVSRNQIHTVEKGFSENQSLLTLDLSYNNLTIFPEELCALKELETLDLRYNHLESLPVSIRKMIGLKAMNTFEEDFQRSGLHLLGNMIIDPPSYIWKSTLIQTLFDYIERKERTLSNYFHHLKLILIGPKHVGKTTLIKKLLHNQKSLSHTQKTLDMYVSMIEDKQLIQNEDSSTDVPPSDETKDYLFTPADHFLSQPSVTKRIFPPPLNTYRSNESSENFINKSTMITTNNFYYSIYDITSEPSFEILYPLIYDSNALFILPINLTILSEALQTTSSSEETDETRSSIMDYESLLNEEWLYNHVYRYIESISDHCQQTSIVILGLLLNRQVGSTDQHQQLLEEIHLKVNLFANHQDNQSRKIQMYSDVFTQPIYFDDEVMSEEFLKNLEIIAQQCHFTHQKQKRQLVKQRLGFDKQEELIIDYHTCFERFKQQDSFDDEMKEMTFDDCLDYLKLTGDILSFHQTSPRLLLVRPLRLLNNVLSRTIFRPHIDRWLNYHENMVFRFSGFYRTEELFNLDRHRLLTRGEFTWTMLNVLFYEQNNDSRSLIEQDIINYCRLMESLSLGYTNETNMNYREFTSLYFVCPWLMNEKVSNIRCKGYFKLLEQTRAHERLQCEQTRTIKQHQIWLAMDSGQGIGRSKDILYEELPAINQIVIADSQIFHQDSTETIRISRPNSSFLPHGLYERLLICFHPFFSERLDYYNITLGRTPEKNPIQIERFDTHVDITTNTSLLERIETVLKDTLFSFYPPIDLRIET